MKTLILDDDEIFLAVARGVFAMLSFDDVTATIDPETALKAVTSGDIDLIVSDLNMPGHDGFAFFKDLADANYDGALIIASGEDKNVLASAKQIARRMRLNIVGTISKPISVASFKEIVEAAKIYQPPSPPTAPNGAHSSLAGVTPALVYQLQVNTFSNRISGTESLLRAQDAHGCLTGPGPLLAGADSNHAAITLTRQIIDIFCTEVALLRRQGCTWPFSLNVDARPLENPDFPAMLRDHVNKHGLSPDDIVLELTESHMPEDPSTLLSAIARLRMAGFHLAMDDFSTGAASFDILRDGAFSEVKLDIDLTRSAAESEASRAFIRNLADIANNLGLRLVAEGIETEQDKQLMESLGVRHMQGYLFAKPVLFDALPPLVHRFMLGETADA
ncbi:MAG: EAL domain-containing response regulator [Pseudomonadota bacterium]